MKIYLASPFFNDEELKNVKLAEDILMSRGFEVFSPRLRMARIEPQSVFVGKFKPNLRQNPREYVSIHCGFFSISHNFSLQKLLRTENEMLFLDLSVQRRSNPDGLRPTISR